MSPRDLPLIGHTELVNLPEFALVDLEAKIDTGADSSALHCSGIVVHGNDTVSFHVLDHNHPNYVANAYTFPVYALRKVKSSNGIAKKRAYIQTTIEIDKQTYPIVLSLTDRSRMSKPMLLGRKFLAGRFLVDVAQEHTFKQRKK
jgi:hypothetical protein